MGRPVFHLAVVVLLQTASGLEWEFGTNLSGSKTIMEKEGVIPSYMREKRVQVPKEKCIDVIYVKVEVEDMPTVTYIIDIGMVIMKFEKGRRNKNSEFRVTAKGVKTEGGKCGGATKKAVTGYPGGQNPYEATPYFQFSKEYFPEDATTNNAFPDVSPPNTAFPNDAHPDDAHPYDAHPDNAHPYNAHPDNAHPYDAHPDDAHPDDAHPDDAHPDDV